MNNTRRKLMQAIIVSVMFIGIFAGAWPSIAQNEKPPLNPEMKRFLAERIRDFDPLRHSSNTLQGLWSRQVVPNPIQFFDPKHTADQWAFDQLQR